MTFDDYAKQDGVSSTMLRKLLSLATPYHFKDWLDSKDETESTQAQEVGKLLHAVALEGAKLEDFCHIKPEGMSFATTDGKAWRAEKQALKDGKDILSFKEAESIFGMSVALSNHKNVSKMLRRSQKELSVFVKDEEFGVIRKCRVDALPAAALFPECKPILDIKTTIDAHPESFEKTIFQDGLFLQAAYYVDTWNMAHPEDKRDSFVFIAVEKKRPFAIALHDLSPEDLEKGRQEYRRLLSFYTHCVKHNNWPGYSQDPQLIRVKEFRYKQAA